MGVKRPSYGMSPVGVEVYLPYSNATKARKSASLACLLVTILKILIQPINKL